MFFDNYVHICEHFGQAPTMVLRKIGTSASAYQNWKSGGEPSNSTKKKLADHFGITIDELTTGKIEKPATTTSDELYLIDAKIMKMLPSMTEQEKRLFLAQMQGVINARES